MRCPLTGIELRVTSCPVRSCMYNREGTCLHDEMTETKPEEWLMSNDLLPQAQSSLNKVKAFVYTDQYVQWSTCKTLYSIKPIEFKDIADSERFQKWPLARESAYAVVDRVLKLVAKSKGIT